MMRMGILVAGLLAASGCMSAPQKCAQSWHARVNGRYANSSEGAALSRFKKYADACLDACKQAIDADFAHADQSEACTENHLLGADFEPDKGYLDVASSCDEGKGNQVACEWIDAHKADIAEYQREAQEEAAQESLPDPSFTSVEDFVTATKASAAAQGHTLVSDDIYSFSNGYIPFAVTSDPGVQYTFILVSDLSTTFTARLHGFGADDLDFDRDKVDGVFAMSLSTHLGEDAEIDRPQIVIADDGGAQNQVRVLIFTN